MRHGLSLGIISMLILTAALQAESAKEIVKKANDKMRGTSSYSEVTMKVVKPTWSREYTMKMWSIEPDYALIYISAPARDKGTVTLKRKNEVWNWVPAAQRVIKIPPSMMMQPWMGSNFTNDDLVREASVVDDYDHTLLGTETVAGYECYKIAMTPKPDAGIVYSKVVTWISKEEYLQLKSDFYDEDGALVKTMTASDVRKIDGRLLPCKMEMAPINKPGEKTVFEYVDIDFDKKIEKDFFSEQNMKKVR